MRYFLLTFTVIVVFILAAAGLRGAKSTKPPFELFPDMDRQLKFKTQSTSSFFADERADRTPVAGTVPFHIPADNPYLYTGKMGKNWGDGIPVEVTMATLKRGQERYNIHCAICHGPSGAGNGIITQYGLAGVANLQQERIQKMADGQIFDTIGHGKGEMGAYPHIKYEDRWAIIAYIRALQLSRNATMNEVPADKRASLGSNPYE